MSRTRPVRCEPSPGPPTAHFLTTDQVATLLEAPAADKPAGLRDRAILETLYSAGLRVSELVALDIGDWDRDSNILRIRGKGRKERIAPVGRFAARALTEWFEVRTVATDLGPRDRDAIFLNRFGRR
ncbi:MAG: hypothetical protein CM1200mP2_48350 [Planctomycetaceae bacterium]|nr:MAG: hypothetical protein CM1200mP2_48350 [Planctomycetaceae bacterium]